jgi:citronellol/citronellal dehydrogenase
MDIREDQQVEEAVKETVKIFGGIDILINNASAIWRQPVKSTPLKRFDLVRIYVLLSNESLADGRQC